MTPKVSIIFPTYNGWQDTRDCVKSIMELDYPQESLELIVVDNSSTDETVNAIQNFQFLPRSGISLCGTISNFQLIKNKINLGFAKAVNKGIKAAKGDYFLITNNDVIFNKDYLKNLIEFSLANPIVGIIGGKVYYKKPKNKLPRSKLARHSGTIPEKFVSLSPSASRNKIAFGGAKFDFYTGILKPSKNPNQTGETDWVSGCNLLVSRKVLEKIGLFDEKFFFYFEDLDLCLRALKAGYKVLYHPKAVMYHGEGASIKREGWQRNSQFYYEGKTRILFKHANKIQLLSSLSFQFTIGMLFQLLILKHQNFTIAFKALLKVLKSPSNPSNTSLPISNFQFPVSLPSVTFIFPTLNGRHLITKILNSIRKQNYPPEKIEVIVVDNASTDGTSEIIKKDFPWVKLIRLKTNTGSAYPITLGAKTAKGEYLLATNDDVVFEKNCLRELIRLALSDQRIGLVTGKMMTIDYPHRPQFFGFRINPYLGYHPYDFTATDKIRECDWAPGACLLVAKSLMKQAGYFDAGYFFCGDDYDFCFQIRSLGYKILYTPRALYYHGFTRAKGINGPSPENLFAHFRGKFRFMIKNATLLQMLTFFPLQILFGPFYSYFKFGHRTFLSIIKAMLWNIIHWEITLNARKEAGVRRQRYFLQD